jgi:type I restriction enzyme S subunit
MRKRAVDTKYLFFALKSDGVVSQITNVSGGSTFGRIDLAAIRSLRIMHPSNEHEQHAIAVRLDSCVTVIKQLGCQLNRYRSLKTALMQDLLTGKVRVTPLLTEPQEAGE